MFEEASEANVKQMNAKSPSRQSKKKVQSCENLKCMNLDFFFLRSCFRAMNEYYKERFRQFIYTSTNLRKQYEQGLSKINIDEMNRNLKAFLTVFFGEELMRSDQITKS